MNQKNHIYHEFFTSILAASESFQPGTLRILNWRLASMESTTTKIIDITKKRPVTHEMNISENIQMTFRMRLQPAIGSNRDFL